MLDMNVADLLSDPVAVLATKKPISVPVRFATESGIVSTREGPVAYEAGAAICRGIEGEEWPIERLRFEGMYEPVSGTEPGRNGLYRKKPVTVRARQITEGRFFVNVGAKRQPIFGDAGDWLIQYAPEKRAIISDRAFRASYDLIAPESDTSR